MKKLSILIAVCIALVYLVPAALTDDYARIYAMNTLGEKRRAMVDLSPERQAEVWRRHFNEMNAAHYLTPEQVNFQSKVLGIVADPERNGKETLEAEALILFPDKTMREELFATIGPFNCSPPWYARVLASLWTQAQPANCVCNVGSSFNRCSNTCGETQGPCLELQSGCGMAFLFPCDALCQMNDPD